MKTAVKNYTDRDLINRMRSMRSFKHLPEGLHIIAVRSQEDVSDRYDDKLYLFRGDICIDVTSCTTNSGLYGLRNFFKWNNKGTAVIKSDEIYYDAFQKSDGSKIRHHNGKMQCLRQIGNLKYYRDNNKDSKIDEVGKEYYANNSTNIHANSYTRRTGVISWVIGKFSTGCIVINNLSFYYNYLIGKIPFNYKVTFTLLKEF